MRYKFFITPFIAIICVILIQSCSTTKYVPDGEYLLANATVKSDKKVMSTMDMETFIKQKPNFRTFAIFKLPLFLYNMSGEDTTKWVNRTLRNAGDPPILYDSTMLGQTVINLERMMTNKGYINAKVTPVVELKDKKAKVTYQIKGGDPYRIKDYIININDSVIKKEIQPSLSRQSLSSRRRNRSNRPINIDTVLYRNTLVRKNSLLDLDMLDQERERISSILRRTGYYAFNKEYVGFDADTTLGNHMVKLDLSIEPFATRAADGKIVEIPHRQYIVKDVVLLVDYNPLLDGSVNEFEASSIYERGDYKIKYGPRGKYISPNTILDNCYIMPGLLFNENSTTLTYSALSQLKILKNINISYTEFIENDSTKLHCIITCVPDKKQGMSVEAEGTNSGGYFGVGASVGYLHRNAFKGSELFSARLRGAYEAITPSFTSFSDNYFEIGGETSLTFPNFLFPFLKKDFKRRIHASTQLNASYTYQRRPGYFTRTVLASGVKYIWQDRRQSLNRHTFDLIEVSYIHLPSIDSVFNKRLSDAARQYSFKDHFILGTGYTFSRTNIASANRRSYQPIYSFRASIETAGNLLALAARLADAKPDSLGSKQVFGTNFAQYVRASADYSKTYQIDEKNSVAWHIGGGIAYPYGNNQQIPIQKRFFSGGANGVRGWSIRELGPGSYYFKGTGVGDDKDNFYYHSGDIRLDASIEYRSKLFWIIEMGAFVDAGNIWTIKDYEDQPGGAFKFNKFYKEVAVAWGLGLRLNFDYVLIRLDCGWKAYDPSGDPDVTRWPIKEPWRIKKNTAWHIAVGYPF
ncbi:outer membrane protein assembly factor [Dysgonomonas sp. 521]|uniref:translocation and assembly module lipoprotein TamL n=1 Tax=Dysgonomonas sp. 521 TaxID=2302932 RepID=UPI0013D82182|nr:BamA/TamA family outer membrane protein [Dysgonomonas sp. 521]NDV96299.1 outer membrane protein assembly factor [Dysgonomonas sp. 521]